MLRAIPGFLVQMPSGEILTLGWVLAIISRLVAGGGERNQRVHYWEAGMHFAEMQASESLVSRHHLYSWGIDMSLTLWRCFVTLGFTMFKLKSLAPCSLSKTASLSIYFCLPHPVWISFVNLYLTTLVFQELASVSHSTLLARLH